MKYQAQLSTAAREREAALPNNLWVQCPYCEQANYRAVLGKEQICPHCGYGFRISARRRVALLTTRFTPWASEILPKDPLHFPGYADKVLQQQPDEAVLTGLAQIGDQQVALGIMDPTFMMGSLGSATGERLTQLFERATEQQLPVIVITASGGARMQEGIHSLMQMAKISQAVARHGAAGLLYISVLTDPTMGGVTASFAMQGDVIMAEPHSMIGFAGRRVIEQTIQQQLPAHFQRAEAVLKNGFIDQIVPRTELASRLQVLLKLHRG